MLEKKRNGRRKEVDRERKWGNKGGGGRQGGGGTKEVEEGRR